jgi:hypothetical protein
MGGGKLPEMPTDGGPLPGLGGGDFKLPGLGGGLPPGLNPFKKN